MVAGLGLVGTGCRTSEPVLPMQRDFGKIEVGQSTATDVLNMLPHEGMLQTASLICASNRYGYSREVGIVKFSETESTVQRKDFAQHRSKHVLPFMKSEEIRLTIQTVVPEEVLGASYENDMRKHTAIMQYCREVLVEDLKPFVEDQEIESLMGLARSALEVGIQRLERKPREAGDLLTEDGFVFDHPTLDKCRLYLRQDGEEVFSIKVRAGGLVDPWVAW